MNVFKLLAVLLLICSDNAFARLARYWSYDELKDKSDLIVIAKPIASRNTKEITNLTENIQPPVPVLGIETTFEVKTILKGTLKEKTLILHHYQLKNNMSLNGPNLVSFDDKNKEYIMFLKNEGSNRYVPVSGQVDPAMDSIKRLSWSFGGKD